MSHSVSRHLRIEVDAYDQAIRRFIRGYEQMVDTAVDAVLAAGKLDRVVDLGSGTGALAERLLERHPTCRVELWDIDGAMLDKARQRLERFGDRPKFCEISFDEPLGEVDAAMASLSLHHVRDEVAKHALYRRIAEALRPGGVFANADVTISLAEEEAAADYGAWSQHQVSQGIEETQTWRNFEEWAEEDRYFSLDEELKSLRDAGLQAECRWREAPSTVTVATRS